MSQTPDPVVIVAARRTPIGNLGGALSGLSAVELGRIAVQSVLDDAKLSPSDVDDVILGQVLTAGAGQNPARQTAIAAGIPHEKTALTVNQVCGSGLRSVALGLQAIASGDSSVVVAGGQESMSQSPHCVPMRAGVKFGNVEMVDTMIRDGLWDAFNGYHMGTTAENIAQTYQITRADQDALSAVSQQRAEKAMAEGKFTAEIVPVKIKAK
ncbi:MAG TPA: acetyl-CoA C-acetyltransferase, partial [Alphaproteobacteria bacterium]|nr:acetyl-CoA C-acetyltransferase [Alphaproteobacteria bacterium]